MQDARGDAGADGKAARADWGLQIGRNAAPKPSNPFQEYSSRIYAVDVVQLPDAANSSLEARGHLQPFMPESVRQALQAPRHYDADGNFAGYAWGLSVIG